MDKLESLGYGDWFRRRVDVEKTATHEVAPQTTVLAFSNVSGALLIDTPWNERARHYVCR